MRALDHVAIISQLGLILRGENTNWGGDRRMSAYAFLRRISTEMPDDALVLAQDVDDNVDVFAEISGVSPSTLRASVRVLRSEPDSGV